MELLMSLLTMLGGVAVFMFGMKQMSLSMEQGAGEGVHNLFKKISKNRVLDYGIGIGATAIVQSSSATSIMTVGLANAGIVDVIHGSGIILGSKVGTTLTAFIFALSGVSKGSFSMSALFASFAFIGVIIMYTSSNDKLNKFAIFIVGFGMLFAGLELMEYAIGGSDSILSVQLQKVFEYDIMFNPICLVILGVLFTAIIQSSTAATGLFLIFLTTGVIGSIEQSFFLIMGANIGTCSDGLMASIGTNSNGKRIAVFHVLTSVIGATAFTIILMIFKTPIVNLFENLFPENPAWSLATFNLVYNVVYTLTLLVFLDPLVDFIEKGDGLLAGVGGFPHRVRDGGDDEVGVAEFEVVIDGGVESVGPEGVGADVGAGDLEAGVGDGLLDFGGGLSEEPGEFHALVAEVGRIADDLEEIDVGGVAEGIELQCHGDVGHGGYPCGKKVERGVVPGAGTPKDPS